MKKLFFALIFIASALFIGSCGAPDGQQAATVDPLSYFSEGGEKVTIIENKKSEYAIYYGSAAHASVSATAKQLSDFFYTKCRAELDFLPFSDGIDQSRAIIYGKTASPLSERLYDAVSSYGDNHTWGIAFEGGTLAVCASTKTAIEDGEGVMTDLLSALSEYITDGTFAVPDGLFRVYSMSRGDYQAVIDERIKAEEDRLAAERLARGEEIKSALENSFSDSDFDIYGTGLTESMSELAGFSYPDPPAHPTVGEHPRVLFTKDDIPGILEALERSESAKAKEKLEAFMKDGTVTGILPPATSSPIGGFHNYDYHTLHTAINKAFAYAVFGDELCGLEAVYIYMNFLKTLDWHYKSNDQCRELGYAMYVGACVYDWCYDLISSENKYRIVMGIEQVLCTGKSKQPDKASNGGVKMEIGFPPIAQGSVDGHGSERQLLQQYLAIAIAVYDEYPDWYDFCAGRIYEDYVDVRNAYYESGMIPQGTYYNGARYISDCFSAALLVAATGDNPYNEEDMHRSFYGIVSYRKNISGVNEVFYVGDCRPVVLPNPPFNSLSLIISHLFSDPVARGIAYKEQVGFITFPEQQERISVAEYFIFSSGGVETSTDPAAELPLISYFGGYRGEIVARSSWTSEDSAIVIMKVQERSTANHEHQAAGTFQIHYKGILSGDMGQYGGQTTDHVRYFHAATVSHNGLLVYNPTLAAANKYYTGGQRNHMSAGFDYDAWISNPNNDTGTVISHKEGYTQSGDAKFAYIDGDITEAYDTVTVDYIARKMLTVFTGDKERPMIMFVFDRIDADSPEFKKTFLLQVPTKQAPVIDEDAKTVEINNGKGKLLLTNILGCDTIEALGGTDAEGNRLNYIVNGEQLSYGQGTTGDGDTWGRVELSAALGNKTDLLFNVIEVADADVDFTDSIKRFSALDAKTESEALFEGVTVGNISALFATAQSLVSKSFKFSTEGDGISEFYVCGLYCGTWTVKIDGIRCGTVYSTKDGGAVSFKAPLGTQIELVPGDDIRPENSGEITYVTNLGVFSKKPMQFYAIGVQTPLPTDITRGTDEFLGWYDNPDFEGEPITHIPKSAGEKFTVYAKWKYAFADEDYTSAELDRTKISYGGIAVIKPEGYLLWQTEDQGPSIQCVVNEFSAFGSTDGVISYELELAKNGDDAPIGFYLRIRDNCEKRHELMLLYSDAQGNVYFGADYRNTDSATPLFTLTENLQTVRILIDFNEGKIYTYDADGRVERSQSFSMSGHASALDFAEGVNEILGIRANNKGTLRIGKIKIADGNIFDKPLSGNKVNYVTNGGSFDANPPISYTPGERFVLSDEVTREGFAFLGWYTDKEFTEKVTEIPQSTEGVFTVYAKWALSLVADYSDGTLSDVFTYNKTNASHTVDADGALVWTTRAANPTVYALANGDISYAGASRVTIEISLSKKADDATIAFNARMRDACSPRCAINLFSSDSSGALYLGYNSKIKLFDLSETMTTLRVTVDFEAKTLSAYDSAGTLHTLTFSYSGTHASADDFAASVNELLGFWAGSAGSLRIGQVKITAE